MKNHQDYVVRLVLHPSSPAGDRECDGYTLGPWRMVEALGESNAALELVSTDKSAIVLVRGPELESVLFWTGSVFAPKPKASFRRGGPLLCGRSCIECSEDHHFVETCSGDAFTEPDHEAVARGVEGWLVCKHCESWVDYDFGEGIGDACRAAMRTLLRVTRVRPR